MLTLIDKEHLERALHSNKVVLFLGAGFSCEAINKNQTKIPTGKKLSEILWRFTYDDDECDDTDLQTVFLSSLKIKKKNRIPASAIKI